MNRKNVIFVKILIFVNETMQSINLDSVLECHNWKYVSHVKNLRFIKPIEFGCGYTSRLCMIKSSNALYESESTQRKEEEKDRSGTVEIK